MKKNAPYHPPGARARACDDRTVAIIRFLKFRLNWRRNDIAMEVKVSDQTVNNVINHRAPYNFPVDFDQVVKEIKEKVARENA